MADTEIDPMFPFPIGSQVRRRGQAGVHTVRSYFWPAPGQPASMVVGIPGYAIGFVIPTADWGEFMLTGADAQLTNAIDVRIAAEEAAGAAAQVALVEWMTLHRPDVTVLLTDDECSIVESFRLADGTEVDPEDEEWEDLFSIVGNVARHRFRKERGFMALHMEDVR